MLGICTVERWLQLFWTSVSLLTVQQTPSKPPSRFQFQEWLDFVQMVPVWWWGGRGERWCTCSWSPQCCKKVHLCCISSTWCVTYCQQSHGWVALYKHHALTCPSFTCWSHLLLKHSSYCTYLRKHDQILWSLTYKTHLQVVRLLWLQNLKISLIPECISLLFINPHQRSTSWHRNFLIFLSIWS